MWWTRTNTQLLPLSMSSSSLLNFYHHYLILNISSWSSSSLSYFNHHHHYQICIIINYYQHQYYWIIMLSQLKAPHHLSSLMLTTKIHSVVDEYTDITAQRKAVIHDTKCIALHFARKRILPLCCIRVHYQLGGGRKDLWTWLFSLALDMAVVVALIFSPVSTLRVRCGPSGRKIHTLTNTHVRTLSHTHLRTHTRTQSWRAVLALASDSPSLAFYTVLNSNPINGDSRYHHAQHIDPGCDLRPQS